MGSIASVLLFMAALVLDGAGLARADESAEANRLLVETVALVERADAAETPGDRAALYERALENLDAIVARYPGSDAAVRLATGQSIGDLSRAAVNRGRTLAHAEQCIADWDRLCLLAVALEMSTAIGDRSNRSWALLQITVAQAEAGASELALETAQAITGAGDRARALAAIANSLMEAGASTQAQEIFLQAITMARGLQTPFTRSETLREIAVRQADAGDQAGARDTLDRAIESADVLEDAEQRARALVAIGTAQAKTGNAPEGRRSLRLADELSGMIFGRTERGEVLSALAWAWADVGDRHMARKTIAGALELTSAIIFQELQDVVLWQIVDAQGKTGDIEQAFSTVEDIHGPFERALAQAAIANHVETLEARRTIILAFETIMTIEDGAKTGMALAFLGLAMENAPNR